MTPRCRQAVYVRPLDDAVAGADAVPGSARPRTAGFGGSLAAITPCRRSGSHYAEGGHRERRVRRYRDDREDRPRRLATGRAVLGPGYVVRASDGAVARERAHGAEWRANAGFPLTVGFLYMFHDEDGTAWFKHRDTRACVSMTACRRAAGYRA